MKEYLHEICRSVASPLFARNKAREYLQALILESMQKSGAMTSCAFHGGTALRFLYALPRFSEDLDFTLERAHTHFDLNSVLRQIKTELTRNGFEVTLKAQMNRAMQSAFIQFPGLLYELNLSNHAGESLAIKIEIDTRPPAGAVLETTLIRRYLPLHLQHHDPATLLAGKINAILTRGFSKGRDWYDLLWYLSNPDWPEPNLVLLENALQQKAGETIPFALTGWREAIWQIAEKLNFDLLRADLSPFMEDERDLQLLCRDVFKKLLAGDW